MEPQNTAPSSSSHNPLLPSNFTAASTFPVQFATANNSNGNLSSPLFMQTLQQLSGLSNSLLQPNAQFAPTVGNQFSATELANWNPQSVWFDQAKMAAMLPMYLQTAVSGSNNSAHLQNASATMEQNVKNQTAAAVAVAAVSNFHPNTTAPHNGNNYEAKKDGKHRHTPAHSTPNLHTSRAPMIASNFSNPSNNLLTTSQNQQQQQQQSHSNRLVMQPNCSSQTYLPHKFQQMPVNVPIQSPLATANSAGSSHSSPRNNSRLLQHQSSSYPSSSSSHPPSNEGMAESPLSTYSNVTQRIHHQQSQEQGVMDACGSPYANYHIPSLFMQHQVQQPHTRNQSIDSSPHLALNDKTNNNNNNCKSSTTKAAVDTTTMDISLSHEQLQTFTNNNLQNESLHNSPHTQQRITHQQNSYQPSRNTAAVGIAAFSHASGVPGSMADNEEDLSILDLHDFEDFLNDKDAVAAALTADPEALFAEGGDGGTVNVDTISRASTMPESQKTSAESRKHCLNNSSASSMSTPLVTSAKMRERIHERRAEELANADKELDRLVSLVARQNDAKFVQNTFQSPKTSNGLSIFNFDLLGSAKLSNQTKISPLDLSSNSETIRLNPVQFTPPDSPTGLESPLTSSASILAAKNQIASNLLSSTLSSLKSQSNNSAHTKQSPLKPQLNHSIASQLSATVKPSTSQTSATFDPTKHSLQRKEALRMMENATKNFGASAAKSQPLVFIPTSNVSPKTPTLSGIGRVAKGGMVNVKYNRVPIYKQRSQNSIFPTRELLIKTAVVKKNTVASDMMTASASPLQKGKSEDAYSFTDDEGDENETAIPTNSNATNHATSSNNAISKPRESKTSDSFNSQSNTPENLSNTQPQRKQRRQNILSSSDSTTVVSAAPAGASFIGGDNSAKKKSYSTHIVDLLRRRRIERSNFVKAIDCMDSELETNDAFEPDVAASSPASPIGAGGIGERRPTATCMIKMETPDQSSTNITSNINLAGQEAKALPKLVIKFIKPEPVEPEPQSEVQEDIKNSTFDDSLMENNASSNMKKQRKKRKKKDRDRDWLEKSESHEKKRKGSHHHHHKKHKRDKRHRSLNSLNDSKKSGAINSLSTRHMSIDQSVFSTSPMHSNGKSEQSHRSKSSEANRAQLSHDDRMSSADQPPPKKSARQLALEEMDREFVKVRLNCFSHSNGSLPKGTFLVAKEDVFKRDCPLWKIDNQNLLQKYPQTSATNGCEIRYKNSSTYSGWCDRIADGYVVVEVKFVKQSRAENIIEPLVPICDLIPAVSSELTENSLALTDAEEMNCDSGGVQENDVPDKSTEHLQIFIKAMLKHVITPNFLSTVRTTNDWNYLCAINEIERQIIKMEEKFRDRIKWTDRFHNALRFYPNAVVEADCPSISPCDICQACGLRPSSSSVQLFAGEEYEDESLKNDNSKFNQFEMCPAIEFAICNGCERLSTLYHQNIHMKYHLFKKSEEHLEKVASDSRACPTDTLIEQCVKEKEWLHNIVKQYIELWRKCDNL